MMTAPEQDRDTVEEIGDVLARLAALCYPGHIARQEALCVMLRKYVTHVDSILSTSGFGRVSHTLERGKLAWSEYLVREQHNK